MSELINARRLQEHLEKENPDYKSKVSEFVDHELEKLLNKRFGNKNKQFIVVDKNHIYLDGSKLDSYSKDCADYINGWFK